MTFAAFSKKIGLPPSTFFRLERFERTIPLEGSSRPWTA
jgi:hypothetical protein